MKIIHVASAPQLLRCTLSALTLTEAQGPAGRWDWTGLALYIWNRLGAENQLINGWSPLDRYVVLHGDMIRAKLTASSNLQEGGVVVDVAWEPMTSKEVTAVLVAEVAKHEEPEQPQQAPSAAYAELRQFVLEKVGAS